MALSSEGDGEFRRSTSIQTHTCTDGVLVFDHWSPASLTALISALSALSHFHGSISPLWLGLLPSLCSSICYLWLCLYVCEGGVKEQRRVRKWKEFPELRGVKVARGFTNLLFFIFVRKLEGVNFYLTAEPLVPSILHSHLTAFSRRLMHCVCLI